jgi:hypothetical protein
MKTICYYTYFSKTYRNHMHMHMHLIKLCMLFLPADINMSTIKWHIPRKCIGDVSCINMFSSTSHDN